MTTTLISLNTPRPLAMMPIILSTSDIITMPASKQLKTSNKYIKLLANVFKIISVKKQVRKAVSTLERTVSLIPIKSAIVSQKRIKMVYNEISIIEIVSKVLDSNILRQNA